MATNRSIQLMLHAVYINSTSPAFCWLPPSGFNLNLSKLCLCFPKDTRLLSNMQAIKLMDAGGGVLSGDTFTSPEGKCTSKIEPPSAFLIWHVWELLVLKPDTNLRRDSLELQSLLGAATMKIAYVGRHSQEAPTGSQQRHTSASDTLLGSCNGWSWQERHPLKLTGS